MVRPGELSAHVNETLSKSLKAQPMLNPTQINTTKSQQNSRIRAAPHNQLWQAVTRLCTWCGQRGGQAHCPRAKEGMVVSPPLTHALPVSLRKFNFLFFFFSPDSIHYSWWGHTKTSPHFFLLGFPAFMCWGRSWIWNPVTLIHLTIVWKANRFWTLLCPICVSSSLRSAGMLYITLEGWLPINIYQTPFSV